jgi:3-hydroxybutyryl-CoA dehydrogenase
MMIKTICVCGAGTMGSGIAQVAAMAGFAAIQFDVNAAMLEKSKTTIQNNLQFLVTKGKLAEPAIESILSKLLFTSNISDCKAELVIEAIIESKEAKVELFNQLAEVNESSTIFATNTSSIAVTEIAAAVYRPERVIGMHFFNPAPLMKLVEVVKTSFNTIEIVNAVLDVSKQFGKTAVTCKDVPGFIVNRVARHYYLEAMRLIELGLADINSIDAVMEASGFKMGPFKLMDLIGMDINFAVSNIVWKALGEPSRLKPSVIQQQKVESGQLGKKTGQGFYTYASTQSK